MWVTAAQPLLLLLLSLSGAVGAEGDTARDDFDVAVWTELRELRDMALGQRVELSAVQTELQSQKTKVEELTRATERETSALKRTLAAMESRLAAMETEKTESRVAFSAALSSTVGPVSALTTLRHNNVLVNVGAAYSPVTGAFTAPVRGVYYFAAEGMDDRYDANVQIDIYKNGQSLMVRWTHNKYDNGGYEYASGALIIALEARDVIDTRMPNTHRLVGNGGKPTIFSGFLLFPL